MYVDTKEATTFRVVPDKPSLIYLADYLRHPEWWPKDFAWDFNHCTTCALQLAYLLWPEEMVCPDPWFAAEAFSIKMRTSYSIFCRPLFGVQSLRSYVRPINVARRIERYLRWGFI